LPSQVGKTERFSNRFIDELRQLANLSI
jgi:hypothetical protein